MLKKLTSLFFSLLLALSLLPGQALAAGAPEPAEPPAFVEAVEPGEPDAPPMTRMAEVPDERDEGRTRPD